MTLVSLIGLAGVALLLWLGNGVRRIGAISTGDTRVDRDGSALLLIDLQRVFWEQGPYSEAAKTAAKTTILSEIKEAQAQGHPVIAIRQEWSLPSTKAVARLTMKGQALEGSDGVELAQDFTGLPDHMIVKRVQDAFETGELDALLERLDVGQLRLVGLDFNFCVQKTALAARNRGYHVTVVKAGTLSATQTEKTEAALISHGVSIC